jgi:hypothetical protein
VPRLQFERLRDIDTLPAVAGLSFPQSGDPLWVALSLLHAGDGGSFRGLKQPECEADYTPHLLPSVKKDYSYTFISPYVFITL